MILRVLVIENVSMTLKFIVLGLKAISAETKERHRIDDIEVHTARSVSEASYLLDEAASSRPYDVLILDLSIPRLPENSDESPDYGMDIINTAKAKDAVKEIIVYSVFTSFDYVADAFRRGAVDFIVKKNKADLQPLERAVLSAWDRSITRQSARLLDERIRTLAPFADRLLAYRFSVCFSRLVQAIKQESEAMQGYLSERFLLDLSVDSDDPPLSYLIQIGNSLGEASQEWSILQASLTRGNETPGEIGVGDAVTNVLSGLLPCLTIKRAKVTPPEPNQLSVLTFAQDVPTVIKEILLGALYDLPDNGSKTTEIEISIVKEGAYAKVGFRDTLKPISAADEINRASIIPPSDHFGREWGLSVAQQIALRGGGRLEVTASDFGNTISYLIPLINHA